MKIASTMRYFKSIKEVMQAMEEVKIALRSKEIEHQKICPWNKFKPIKSMETKHFMNHYI